MIFRKADISELHTLAQLRQLQLIDESQIPDTDIIDEIRKYMERHMAEGSMVEWVAEDEGQIVATSAIVFMDFPPSFTNPCGIRGYITNVYTRPRYRGQGLALKLLDKLVDEANLRGISTMLLAASDMGRPVYQKYGFKDLSGWMELSKHN